MLEPKDGPEEGATGVIDSESRHGRGEKAQEAPEMWSGRQEVSLLLSGSPRSFRKEQNSVPTQRGLWVEHGGLARM